MRIFSVTLAHDDVDEALLINVFFLYIYSELFEGLLVCCALFTTI